MRTLSSALIDAAFIAALFVMFPFAINLQQGGLPEAPAAKVEPVRVSEPKYLDLDALCEAPAPVVTVAKPTFIRVPAIVTAYTPGVESCGASADGRTSTMVNTDVYPYGIAADPRIVPYGAKIRVDGYLPKTADGKWWKVDDTGGAMRKSWRRSDIVHIDLRFKTVHSAREWGTRWMYIDISYSGLTEDQISKLQKYLERTER